MLTKISGRKYPPHEKELLESKLFIDDFQFFMNHIVPNEKDKVIGILFFNSKKKSTYLGKKILRDLIY